MRQMQPHDGHNLSSELLRPDLRAIGVILVRSGREETDTLWCDPDTDPAPLFAMASEAGNPVAALILVGERDVMAYLDASWQRVSWFTQYVEGVTREIHQQGLEAFLRWVMPSVVAARN